MLHIIVTTPFRKTTRRSLANKDLRDGFVKKVSNMGYMPIVQKSAVLAVLWIFCFWLYRQKIFVRI